MDHHGTSAFFCSGWFGQQVLQRQTLDWSSTPAFKKCDAFLKLWMALGSRMDLDNPCHSMPIVYVCSTRHHVLAASGCSTGRHAHTLIDTLFLQAFHHFSISICWHLPPSSPWSNCYCCSHMLTAHPQHKLVLQCFAVVWILEKMINTYWKTKSNWSIT